MMPLRATAAIMVSGRDVIAEPDRSVAEER
jgi:hypothetical protein